MLFVAVGKLRIFEVILFTSWLLPRTKKQTNKTAGTIEQTIATQHFFIIHKLPLVSCFLQSLDKFGGVKRLKTEESKSMTVVW